MPKIKVLTNVKFAQTAGIAQVVSSFMDFIEASKKPTVNIVAINITDSEKESYRKISGKKTSVISVKTKMPNMADVINAAKNLEQVKQKFEKVIGIYQKAIQKEKPDLVLINGTYFMPWCFFIASEREGVPAVLHYHGILSKETQNWEKRQREIFLDMERSFDRKDMYYIFPSKMTKDIVEKDVFCHKIKKFSILPNPVSEHFFTDKIRKKKLNIGIVSRWAGIKNVSFCKKLAEYNCKKGSKFIVNIITDINIIKNDDYVKLSKIVKFYKPKSNKKLASFYRNMGVVISPSHFETYGNVAKESIASGTPAMVNCNMGVSETFNNLGLGGWVIDFDSVKSVYEKIESVMGDKVHKNVTDKMKELYMPHTIFTEIVAILNNAV